MRWISIVVVVFHHCVFVSRYDPGLVRAIVEVKSRLGWCVPVFFFASGFLAPAAGPVGRHLLRRAERLLAPYVLVSAIHFVSLFVLWKVGIWRHTDPTDTSVPEFLRRLVCLEGTGPQMYFLPYLLVVSLVVVPARRFLGAFPAVLLMVLGLAIQCVVWIQPTESLGAGAEKLLHYGVAFACGAWFASRPRRSELLPVALLGVAAFLAAHFAGSRWPIDLWVPTLLYAILVRTPLPAWLAKASARWNPGSIYLWHAPVMLPALSVLLFAAHVGGLANLVLAILIACPACLALGSLVARLPGGRYLGF
jgi:fucose 4-O-acetylase-like acetyltransferase